jgi:group I intron endonuclease
VSNLYYLLEFLFSLPQSYRYNFLSTAGSSLGYKHSEESKAKISDFLTGANNHMYGRTGANHPQFGITPTNAFHSGANLPMYGWLPTNAMTIYVYSIDNVLVETFSSQVACAKWLEVSNITVIRYIRSGKIFQGKYLLTSSPL